jgi:hypothetical protein
MRTTIARKRLQKTEAHPKLLLPEKAIAGTERTARVMSPLPR